MDAAEQWEPDDARVSRPVLREPGGEIPPDYSPRASFRPYRGRSILRVIRVNIFRRILYLIIELPKKSIWWYPAGESAQS